MKRVEQRKISKLEKEQRVAFTILLAVYVVSFLNGPFPVSFSLFLSFQYSRQ